MGLSLNKLNNCIFFLSLVFLSGCGGGGGSSSFASAGGSNATGIDEAFSKFKEIIGK